MLKCQNDALVQEVGETESEEDAARAPFALHALELGPGHCLISLDFWLLFFVCAVGAPPFLPLSPCQNLHILLGL